MSIRSLFIPLILVFVLVACSPSTPAATSEPTRSSPSSPAFEPSKTESLVSAASELARVDNQGAVEVSVTPVNLNNPEETLIFEVVLNTHSVDLSMDLATVATLNTDTGKSVRAAVWEAPRGGHHVEGKLSFPASVDGEPLLEGAKTLTLTIIDLDVPERILAWDLSQ